MPRMAFGLSEDRSRASRGTPAGPKLVRSEQRLEAAHQRMEQRTGFRVTSNGEFATDSSGNKIPMQKEAATPVTKQELEQLFMQLMPEEIRALMFNRMNFAGSTTSSPVPGAVATIGADGVPCWADGGSLAVYGTPGLYKGVFLRGWTKASSSAAWVAMTVAQETATPPAKLDTEFVDGTDAYPWTAWRPTWDYVRAHQ